MRGIFSHIDRWIERDRVSCYIGMDTIEIEEDVSEFNWAYELFPSFHISFLFIQLWELFGYSGDSGVRTDDEYSFF